MIVDKLVAQDRKIEELSKEAHHMVIAYLHKMQTDDEGEPVFAAILSQTITKLMKTLNLSIQHSAHKQIIMEEPLDPKSGNSAT
jgi:hypothetical protein